MKAQKNAQNQKFYFLAHNPVFQQGLIQILLFSHIKIITFWNSSMTEQAKVQSSSVPLKKEHSYTYWVNQKNKSRQLPEQHKPKKIEGPTKLQQIIVPTGPSKWNSSGTWEERTVSTKELNETVKSAIQKWLSQKQCELALKEVDLSGEFKQIFSNNKRKVLYEITGKISFEGEDLVINLLEFTCSGDREYKVQSKKAEERAKLESVVDCLAEVVVQVFNGFKQ